MRGLCCPVKEALLLAPPWNRSVFVDALSVFAEAVKRGAVDGFMVLEWSPLTLSSLINPQLIRQGFFSPNGKHSDHASRSGSPRPVQPPTQQSKTHRSEQQRSVAVRDAHVHPSRRPSPYPWNQMHGQKRSLNQMMTTGPNSSPMATGIPSPHRTHPSQQRQEIVGVPDPYHVPFNNGYGGHNRTTFSPPESTCTTSSGGSGSSVAASFFARGKTEKRGMNKSSHSLIFPYDNLGFKGNLPLSTPLERGFSFFNACGSELQFSALALGIGHFLSQITHRCGAPSTVFALQPKRNSATVRNPKLNLSANISLNGKSSLTRDAKKGSVTANEGASNEVTFSQSF
ncbi:hypothetical protein CAPTEDRAFT_207245 [Capitella teleta]|uniref:Uncharacterized protein n=1 Tax=Capitella teleta TaxID=283909 RepID=R7TUF8_CAPTE|nr:hypothetical protein CAPTEDRAFT_207245 [Capitella teleta]|eukprot:ELT94660.1 hypothetical protein CAPTEDRAFT_207245 [Capitella teleta]